MIFKNIVNLTGKHGKRSPAHPVILTSKLDDIHKSIIWIDWFITGKKEVKRSYVHCKENAQTDCVCQKA